MAVSLLHRFVSGKGDGTDATLVRPSNWNDEHNLNMSPNNVLGRLTGGTGPAEEIPASPFMMSLLTVPDLATLSFMLGIPTTGEVLLSFKATPPGGWIMMDDGSIGNAASNATNRHHPDTVNLFTLLYNSCTDLWVPIQTSAGVATTRAVQGAAATAYANNCRLVLPRTLGRTLIAAGIGHGSIDNDGDQTTPMTNHALGAWGGYEYYRLWTYELPSHYHIYNPVLPLAEDVSRNASPEEVVGGVRSYAAKEVVEAAAGAPEEVVGGVRSYAAKEVVEAAAGVPADIGGPPMVTPYANTGNAIGLTHGGTALDNRHPNMQPWFALNIFIRL